MSVFRGIFRAVGDSTSVSDLQNPALWLKEWAQGRRTTSGEYVSPDGAKALSAYYDAVRVIAEDVAKLPLITYRKIKPRGRERATDLAVYNLLKLRPNKRMMAYQFRELLTGWAVSLGNGTAEIQRGFDDEPISLNPIHPSRVTIKTTSDVADDFVYIIRNDRGVQSSVLRPENVLHVRGMGDNQWLGQSVASVAAESLGVALAAQRYGASFFGQGAAIGGVLEHPGVIGDGTPDGEEALKRVRANWQDVYGGAVNAGKVAILEEGMKFSKITVPPEEAQFVATREFSVVEICRWFRITPHKLQDLSKAHYANLEFTSIEHLSDCLLPWLIRWEQEIQIKLLGADQDEIFAEHLVDAILRGDSASRGEFYAKQFMNGVLSQNDIREKENLNPLAIDPETGKSPGDTYYVPLNLVPSEIAVKGPQAMKPQSSGDSDAGKDDNEYLDSTDPQDVPEGKIPVDDDSTEDEAAGTVLDPGITVAVLRAAVLPVFEGAWRQVTRKEMKAIARAATKYKDDETTFRLWLDHDFFSREHRSFVEDLLSHGVDAVRVATSSARKIPVTTVDRHLEASRREAERCFSGGSVEEEFAAYCERRPRELAAETVKEVFDGE